MLEEVSAVTIAKLPISEFANHLRLGSGFSDDGSEDAVLEVFLRSALAAIEVRIGKALIRRSFSWQVTRWFETGAQALPISPVVAITSVTVFDKDAVPSVVDPGKYGVEIDIQRSKLVSVGGALANIPSGGHAEVVFEAGFGVWLKVPADLRQAVLLLAAHYYENRTVEGRGNGLPVGVSALIEGYRPARIGGAR